MNKAIIIFSVEGTKSNTEILFYRGLADWLDEQTKLYIFAIGMSRESETRKDTITNSVRLALGFNGPDTDEPHIFFIGDGDNEEQFKPMQRATGYAIEFLKDFYENPIIHSEVIKDIPFSFEKSFERIKGSSFVAYKKKTNRHLFNIFVKDTSWEKENKFEIDQAIKELEEIKSNHAEIFKTIRNDDE